jgi:hypothetical protein
MNVEVILKIDLKGRQIISKPGREPTCLDPALYMPSGGSINSRRLICAGLQRQTM